MPEGRAHARFGLLPAGRALLENNGIPESFAVFTERRYGQGAVWALGLELSGRDLAQALGILARGPYRGMAMPLDEPTDERSRFRRLSLPLVALVAEATPASAKGASSAMEASSHSLRAGRRYLERHSGDGQWEPWFAKGINLGPASPGRWFGQAPSEEAPYAEWLGQMAEAGFDALRVYTLLPPAFYRALAAHNSSAAEPLFLIQEIWPDEDVPGHDLADEAYLDSYFLESDRVVDALFGRAEIGERPYRAWGSYRSDISPWLAALLVGRELLPEEVIATAEANAGTGFQGMYFSAPAERPVEAVLARMAERAAARMASYRTEGVPIGFVSWPTLDTLHHPSEWQLRPGNTAISASPPYHDLAEIDIRAIEPSGAWTAGRFAAFHVYPNYPDFMYREARFAERDDGQGFGRYQAYLEELAASLEGVPLLVAEFGLATGFGTAHIHPEGLDHGGLSEERQASGLVGMFEAIARSGCAGGVVFEWADEWAKKTWTTEPYTVPYERNPFWHNAIDPEQNYGIMSWAPADTAFGLVEIEGGEGPSGQALPASMSSWQDYSFLYLQLSLPPEVAIPYMGDGWRLDIGLDVIPGTGERRLSPGGIPSPQGSEFVVRARIGGGKIVSAALLAQADYNRGGGRLYPRDSALGGYTRMLSMVNAPSSGMDGSAHASIWEDGSAMPAGKDGLIHMLEDGAVFMRLPWSRLNLSDPSSGMALFDPIPDSRAVSGRDRIKTLRIGSIGVWAIYTLEGSGYSVEGGELFLPGRRDTFRIPLPGWEYPSVVIAPKKAYEVLRKFLPAWEPSCFGN